MGCPTEGVVVKTEYVRSLLIISNEIRTVGYHLRRVGEVGGMRTTVSRTKHGGTYVLEAN